MIMEGNYNIIGEGNLRIIERQNHPRLTVTVDLSTQPPEIKNIIYIDHDSPEAGSDALREINDIVAQLQSN